MIIFFSYIQKGLNIHNLNITKITKKDYKKKVCKVILKKKKKKQQHRGHKWYKSLLEDEKQKLFEYQQGYYKMRKTTLVHFIFDFN